MNFKDKMVRFIFEDVNIRGEYIFLDASLKAVLEKQAYPEPVRALLAEAVTAAALLSATLKFTGSLTLQIRGDGPVSLLVVQVTSEKQFRGMASWHDDGNIQTKSFAELLGNGNLVMTLEPEASNERYQSIVHLENESLTASLAAYFAQSEQLNTRFWLASVGDQSVGILLQELPRNENDDIDDDAWSRINILTDTLTEQEAFSLSPEALLGRLFSEETVRLFRPEPVSFRCTCSREKTRKTLRSLAYSEIKKILDDEGEISIDCGFCNHAYVYDAIDIEQLFLDSCTSNTSNIRH